MSRLYENRLALILAGAVALSVVATSAEAFILKANQVSNLTTQDVLTVAPGSAVAVTSMVVSNGNGATSCCARLFKSGADVTGFISLPAGASLQVHFDPPIKFKPGQIIQVRNGASAGALDFTLNATFVTP